MKEKRLKQNVFSCFFKMRTCSGRVQILFRGSKK